MSQNQPQGCLGLILQLLGIIPDHEKKENVNSYPYQKKKYFFSKAERSFLGVLQKAVDNQYCIFAKVRIADLIGVQKGTKSYQSYFNRINAKHVDFVLCDKESIQPLIAIELDDSSHERVDRQGRDEFVDRAFVAARLPLLRVKASNLYHVEELARQIEDQLG